MHQRQCAMCERDATIIGEPHEACLEPPTESATYKHQPLSRSLDEIRLLKLRKEEHGPVHCDVEVFPLEQAPEYIALSYRWGPPSPLHDIFIGEQTLKIRDILNSCLLELREDVDTWLWIDQICIAQADTTERNHQVGMMSRIYSTGASVMIWLGDVPLTPPGEVDRFNDQDLDATSITVLLNNIYFTRLWIVQEILLAKTVNIHLNGNRCIEWSSMYHPYITAYPSLEIPTASTYLLNSTMYAQKERITLTWTQCIDGFSANACEDLRDKVYGMIGVVREQNRLAVDYQKSVLKVYTDVLGVM
ncbi:uncharacterized protein J4E78_007141 [Alternaria triticimaculans]|uniref:uncharacterized protein n=1 Tax=Alternaria triticimaculans TaxID=297637 RepID=UPI0020C1FE37|nr:uncharacterized protein J4E78_007141 [Alternaria triticimaculans]KAI4654962.1 hypothetical protein J4E78_007141 [Alternaria triticimaculans]